MADTKDTNRLFRRLNLLFWCFGGAPSGFISGVLAVLKLLATVAQKMPGVEAMSPTGKEIATLNGYGATAAEEYHYIMANYDFSHLPAKIIAEIVGESVVFNDAPNDLVVPYEGASQNNKYLAGFTGKHNALSFGTTTTNQSDVWHITFFEHTATKNVLSTLLP